MALHDAIHVADGPLHGMGEEDYSHAKASTNSAGKNTQSGHGITRKNGDKSPPETIRAKAMPTAGKAKSNEKKRKRRDPSKPRPDAFAIPEPLPALIVTASQDIRPLASYGVVRLGSFPCRGVYDPQNRLPPQGQADHHCEVPGAVDKFLVLRVRW